MPAPARARKRADPKSDPRYKRVVAKLDADAKKLKKHPPASRKAREPGKAAKGPPDEKAAGARAKQVEKLEKADTPTPETGSFLAILQAEIAKAMPKTLGDTEKFMKGGSSGEMKGALKGNVDQQKNESTGDLKKTSNEAPNEAGVQAKPVTPIPREPGAPTPRVDAAAAMPAPRPQEEVSLESSKRDVAEDMKKAQLTDERLKKANDPRFSAVLSKRDAVKKQADTAPGQYRSKESGTLAGAASAAVGVAKKGVSMLLGVKGGSKAKVLSRQEKQKQKEEQELQKFTTFVKITFDEAKQRVDQRLELLETKVNDLFDRGIETALARMKTYVEDELFKYKLDRYLLHPLGTALWIKDQFLDLPAEVNRFYAAGRARFTTEMNALAVRVASLVETQLAAAKADVKQAQGKIARAQKALSPSVQARAAQVTSDYAEKFAELESGIEDKKQQLAEGLAQKYKEAFDKADAALKEIQDANKGLVTQAKEAIGAVLKALAEFKSRIMGILRKGADTIDLILKDPIGFLGNLLAALKQGFNGFVGNILEHMKAGFIKWLFGSLTKMGIELPKDLSLPSILKLVLGVLGITYANMRAKAVKLVGEKAVAAIEKVVEYVEVLIKGGPAALWEKIKDDLSNLKEMVIDAVRDWIVTTIIKRATAKIVSMFNPAGAIIQAIMLIYDVITFIVTKANQILEFVEAVVSSVHSIATGAIGAAAKWIEKSLANMVPLLIGFLAQMLGLGGVSEKIKEFIKKVQGKVDKAIDKVLKKIVDAVKKLFGKLAGKKGAKPDERTDAQKKADLDKALRDTNAALADEPRRNKAEKKLGQIKKKYRLTRADIIVDEKKKGMTFFHAELEINPIAKSTKAGEMDFIDPPIKLRPPFYVKKSLDKAEFERQVQMSQDAMNEMSVHTWLTNVEKFRKTKQRSKEGTREQQKTRQLLIAWFRSEVVAEREKVYMAPPFNQPAPVARKNASSFANRLLAYTVKNDRTVFQITKLTDTKHDKKTVENLLHGKAVLHRLDQVAGGGGTDLAGMGGEREDFSLGAQWGRKSRLANLKKDVNKEVKGLKADDRKKVRMNVELLPVKDV